MMAPTLVVVDLSNGKSQLLSILVFVSVIFY
jgi:hypothetical protein